MNRDNFDEICSSDASDFDYFFKTTVELTVELLAEVVQIFHIFFER